MIPGVNFELESLDYLINNYGNNEIKFIHHNTADSTGSDIEVIKNGNSIFFIEVKDTSAQSGQFVLLPNDVTRSFEFSPRNRSVPNEMTRIMIEYMNADYERFNDADTAGEELYIDPNIFTKWIIGHYKSKNVKYVISKRINMVICPIDKFGEYFSVSAKFRIKKSGSSEPSSKYVYSVIATLQNDYGLTDVYQYAVNKKKKLFVNAPIHLSKVRFELGNYTYYLSPQEKSNYFEVRQLSNTRNKNVIFSINVIKEQEPKDLIQFEAELI